MEKKGFGIGDKVWLDLGKIIAGETWSEGTVTSVVSPSYFSDNGRVTYSIQVEEEKAKIYHLDTPLQAEAEDLRKEKPVK